MIVVDASAVIESLLQTACAPAVEAFLFRPGETLHAPHLIDVEVTQVLRRYAITKAIDVRRCQTGLEDWLLFPVNRYGHDVLLARAWELRDNVTACDAVYIALAELLSAPLLTRDVRLSNAAGHKAKIQLI